MKNIWLMTWYTLREAMARKVFIFFMIISAVVILLCVGIFSVIETQAIIEGMSQSGNQLMLKEIVSSLELLITSHLSSMPSLVIFSVPSFMVTFS